MVYEMFLNIKQKYPTSIVLIKVGNFYHIYDKDAIILNYLLKYKIVDNKVGFPVRSLKKVTSTLKKNKISYYISDEECEEEADNNYNEVLDKSLKYYELNKDVEEIIKYLNDNIERKFIKRIITKIKEVIDEG